MKKSTKLIKRITPKIKSQILYYKHISHRSCKEIAQRLGISEQIVRSIR